MNKYVNIIGIVIAVIYLAQSFTNLTNPNIFGFVVNIWFYRLFWGLLLVVMAFQVYRKSKKQD